MKNKLRPWQSEALSKAWNWLVESKKGKHFLINAAPGAGKTICASVIAKKLLEHEEIDRVVVIAPRAEVVKQWAEEYKLVTGRPMVKVTGADGEISDFGVDVSATWSAIQGLADSFQQICRKSKTLIICDEHHHAAVEAAWGKGANSAFQEAAYVLILSGTPIRSDGQEPVWFAYDSEGQINHPEAGTYTLTYGEAVDLDYCRPITFHRHEGEFSVALSQGESIPVSGTTDVELTPEYKRIKGLQQALDFYKLACTPKYLSDGKTPDPKSYQASMLEWGILKLNDIRDTIPDAGGLVIAPSIEVAKYMALLLEQMDGEKPILVHSQMPNTESHIEAYKNSKRRWIVSVSMISEGVDIKRLRILVYLPYPQTELYFRQAMGRVVRSLGNDDYSRAYVVMPTHHIFDAYARRVEQEMSPAARKENPKATTKTCPSCGGQCAKDATECSECGHAFSLKQPSYKKCDNCEALNPLGAETCQECGHSFKHEFEITLNEALRLGAIVRGMDLNEDEVRDGEQNSKKIQDEILSSGDDTLIKLVRQLPAEAWGRLKDIINKNQKD